MADNTAREPGRKSVRHTPDDKEITDYLGVSGVSVSTIYSDALEQWKEFDTFKERAAKVRRNIRDGEVTVGQLIEFVMGVDAPNE